MLATELIVFFAVLLVGLAGYHIGKGRGYYDGYWTGHMEGFRAGRKHWIKAMEDKRQRDSEAQLLGIRYPE